MHPMEKKPMAASAAPGAAAPPVGVCERLFNAFQIHPAFTNIRRLTNRQSGAAALAHEQGPLPVPTAPPMATTPQPGPPSTTPSRPYTPVLVPVKSTLGRENSVGQLVSRPREQVEEKLVTAAGKIPPARTDTPSVVKTAWEATPAAGKNPPARTDTPSVVKTASEATPPQANVGEPNGSAGQPEAGKSRRNINEKVEKYFNRTRNRVRAPSHRGKTTTTT